MRTLPPEPNPGDRISANLIRELIRAIRERTPISGHGVKVSIGPNGSIISINSESISKAKAKDNGRFKIKSLSVSEAGGTSSKKIDIEFDNRYYRIGGRTYTCASESIQNVDLPTVVALKVDLSGSSPVPTLTNFDSMSDLNSEDGDTRYFISPLYKFDENGVIECDFRIGPDSGIWEFAQ